MRREKPSAQRADSLSDQELISRIRSSQRSAFGEFFERFHLLLIREAKRLGVQEALREEVVVQCLDDAVITLMRPTAPVPRSLTGYLITALRHDVINARRDERRREDRSRSAVHESSGTSEWIVSESCSEESVRASNGPGWEALPLAPAIERLASALDEGLSDDERRLLAWVGQWVPQRIIAEWLGISYGATRVRVLRLRDRLREAALRHAGRLNNDEQRVLYDFFRRTATVPLLNAEPRETTDEMAPKDQPTAAVRRDERGPAS